MANTYYLSKEKLKELQAEYETIRKSLHEETVGDAPSLLESGDPNPDFSVFEANLEERAARLEVLENILKNYKIIENPPQGDRDKIQLGARVVCQNGEVEKIEYKIVGTVEANPFEGKISNESPVGMAFLGKKVGDIINLPQLSKNYKILRIQYGDA